MISPQVALRLPKVELHVHLEGSIRPETLLKIAQENAVELPAKDLAGLKQWYTFRDFPHFVDIYTLASSCIKTPANLETIAWEFAVGQAEQNILYTEVTYTALTIYSQSNIPFDQQIEAIHKSFTRAKAELGIDIRLVLDVCRHHTAEEGAMLADWAISAKDMGVVAYGLSGIEELAPISIHTPSFERVKAAGLKVTSHAGETKGAASIKEALEFSLADRIGHGVRCVEDPFLVKRLRDEQIHLEVCPTSNVCLGVVPSLEEHPLARLLDEGLNVSINSDDPPMFGTTLTDELTRCAQTFEFNKDLLYSLTMNAVNAAFLPKEDRAALRLKVIEGYSDVDDESEEDEAEDN
jgi:adenosine deaminase